ncbi:DUF3987 domain-containing protein [Rhizobium laguerreae]|uniref:DUF3987 domain-containing protein n=1 Tax=Rhizobium laguerreae TaxID=1076926 RepID=UPI001C908FC5|nr:DUF3987 domain-containing protein [Rhizobium laguerreae]MBY3194254.1 DUF3987 domain-containing protein [Rhizobium laguerreae]
MSILPTPGTITNIAGIPQDLRNIAQWVLWKPLWKNSKVAKMPCFLDGDGFDHSNPANWRSFEAVVADMQSSQQGHYGIGIVLAGSGIVCIDYDDHDADDRAAVAAGATWASDTLRDVPTYAETSISGKGQHILYRGVLPHGRTGSVLPQISWEVYSASFIAITGNTVWGSRSSIADGQAIIDAWKIPAPVRGAASLGPSVAIGQRLDLTDAEVAQTLKARRPKQFATLISPAPLGVGNRGRTYAQIIGDLDKITGDPEQIDRMMRQSPMLKNAHNFEKYDRQGERWLMARHGCSNLFEYWLKKAREGNDRCIPFAEVITQERIAFLEQVMRDTLAYQAKQDNAMEIADATRTIADVLEASETPATTSIASPVADYHIRDESGNVIGFDYPTPYDPWATFAPPDLPQGLLPHAIERFANARSEVLGADAAGLAMAGLVTCSSALSDTIRLQPKVRDSEWTEASRLWCGLIGDPSTKKTPAVSLASAPLHEIESNNRARYEDALKVYEQANKGKKKGEEDTPPPPLKRRIVSDTTIEALQRVLKDNPDCVMLFRDELSGWFGSMDKYSSGGKGASGDRPFWLQSYNGGAYVVDRISREGFIKYLSVNLIGGIQPEILRKTYTETDDDGMMQRILPIVLKPATRDKDIDDGGAFASYCDVVRALYHITVHDIVGSRDGKAILRFDAQAQQVFESVKDWVEELSGLEAINKKLSSSIGKWVSLFTRLSLLFHMIEHASVPHTSEGPRTIPNAICERTALAAWDFMREFLLQHLFAFYKNVMSVPGEKDEVELVAEFLLATGKAQVSFSDIIRGVQRPESTNETLAAALGKLEKFGWVERAEGKRRNSNDWYINAECHRRYATKAQTIRDERAKAFAAIQLAAKTRRER